MPATAQAVSGQKNSLGRQHSNILKSLISLLFPIKILVFLRKLWITQFDLRADPGLSRRLDCMTSWCPFQLKLPCFVTTLCYKKMHTKTLTRPAAERFVYVSERHKRRGSLCMVKNQEVEGVSLGSQHSTVGRGWNWLTEVPKEASTSIPEYFWFWLWLSSSPCDKFAIT